jgi:5'(3')-deoxyribonucleotidase
MEYTIYFDMDGVLADFVAKWDMHYPDRDISGDVWISPKELYDNIKDIPCYWTDIPFIDTMRPLWDYCYGKHTVEILSAPLDHDYDRCIEGKDKFLDKHLGEYEFGRNYHSHDKKCLLADSKSLLIDDNKRNVAQFREKGGLAILHETHNTQRTMDILKYGFGL